MQIAEEANRQSAIDNWQSFDFPKYERYFAGLPNMAISPAVQLTWHFYPFSRDFAFMKGQMIL
ncbi:MAG TPA: hypothetical protein VIB00_09345 [Pyrinomonadaceae bacterium]|jgi:hypothetical protein